MVGQTTSRPCRWGLSVIFASMAWALLISPLAAQSSSSARIVRLSFVDGTVNLQRPGVNEWAKAFINTPIQQGFELATGANSFAEAEFENGSTARLGQTASLQFTELSLGPDGNKINRLTLSQGYATFTVSPERGDVYQVDTPQGSFTSDGKAIFRVDLDQSNVRLEVFKGHVRAQSQYGEGRIGGNHVLEVRPGDAEAYRVTSGITLDAWDRWVEQRNGALEASRGAAGYRTARAYGSPYNSLYGWNDLYYYGNWTNLPGYGYGWVPYAAGGWSPYTLGSWAYYPGFGYTWISSLPWGWLPFHYGNWVFASGYGWSWLPGNFGAWSPAVVSWYQGPGWIGWSPLAGRYRTATYGGCQPGQNCATAVSLRTFQSGGFVSPNTLLKVDPAQGRIVTSPTVAPTRFVQVPGPIVSSPNMPHSSQNLQITAGSVASPSGAQNGRQTFVTRTSAASAAPHTVVATPPHGFGVKNPPGIVFNSQTNRYERSYGLAGQMSGTGGNGNRSNPGYRNSASGSQSQMNRGAGASAPRTQPSGGFGPSMQMPGGMGGGMGGGMQAPHSGGGGSQGPHH